MMWLIRNTSVNIKHALWQIAHLKARYWHNILFGLCRAVGRDLHVFVELMKK